MTERGDIWSLLSMRVAHLLKPRLPLLHQRRLKPGDLPIEDEVLSDPLRALCESTIVVSLSVLDAVASDPDRRHAAVIRDRVVPEPNAMDVAPGRQRGARRHADWRVTIGVVEAHAARRKPVEVRRADHRMTGAAEHARVVLVAQYEEQVRGLHTSS